MIRDGSRNFGEQVNFFVPHNCDSRSLFNFHQSAEALLLQNAAEQTCRLITLSNGKPDKDMAAGRNGLEGMQYGKAGKGKQDRHNQVRAVEDLFLKVLIRQLHPLRAHRRTLFYGAPASRS